MGLYVSAFSGGFVSKATFQDTTLYALGFKNPSNFPQQAPLLPFQPVPVGLPLLTREESASSPARLSTNQPPPLMVACVTFQHFPKLGIILLQYIATMKV